jgi:hypothetical protein
VAVVVVDLLEVVEVEKDDAHLEAVALGATDLAVEGRLEIPGVVEIGHVVDERLLARLQQLLGIYEGERRLGHDELGPLDLLLLERTSFGEDPDRPHRPILDPDGENEQLIIDLEPLQHLMVLGPGVGGGGADRGGLEELSLGDLVPDPPTQLVREAAEADAVLGALSLHEPTDGLPALQQQSQDVERERDDIPRLEARGQDARRLEGLQGIVRFTP